MGKNGVNGDVKVPAPLFDISSLCAVQCKNTKAMTG